MIPVLDLFSGIGGISLGLESTGGFRTAAFCEADPFCRRVLAKHWPEVPCYDDIRTLTAARLSADGIAPWMVCGGFPCQDVSAAGPGGGLDGARSGLWFEMHRIIEETRPRWVLAENVPALRSRGMEIVLSSLQAIGYDAQWHCIPAAAIGAPHRRDRIWILAHPNRQPRHERRAGNPSERPGRRHIDRGGERQNVADADRDGAQPDGGAGALAGAPRAVEGQAQERQRSGHAAHDRGQDLAHPNNPRLEKLLARLAGEFAAAERARSWPPESGLGRVAYGVPSRVDRLRALGNAVVPQIPAMIGRAILAADRRRPPIPATT